MSKHEKTMVFEDFGGGFGPAPTPDKDEKAALDLIPIGEAPTITAPELDFASVTMPEVELIDFASIIDNATPVALGSTTAGVTNALGLANAQGDANADAIQRATDLSIAQATDVHASLSAAVLASNMAVIDITFPEWRATVNSAAGTTQAAVNAAGMFLVANLPTMLRQGQEMATMRGDIVTSLLKGEMPKSFSDQMERRSEETANANGIIGSGDNSARQKLIARDFGLSELSMKLMGAEMAKDPLKLWEDTSTSIAAMASAATAPITAFAEMQKSLNLTPDVDINKIYADTFAANVKATTVDPDNVFNAAMSHYNAAMGWGVNVAQTNQAAQAEYDSMVLQFEADKMNATTALHGATIAANSTLWTAQMNANATQNAATINANSMMESAYANANATIQSANAGAKASIEKAKIDKGKWETTKRRTGTKSVNYGGGPSIDVPVYTFDEVFKY